ncbi:cysteine hydrolase [Haladaptatus sp. DJG-WS-42]|uniref:cysteine hydrolase family protein n=1 Tax=Haladaptatus sp. DJG-WS-42 TaxID=3120516 RepID=UPI0030D5AD69
MISDPVLVLIDLQKDFCKQVSQDGTVFEAHPVLQPKLENVRAFLDHYRASGRTPIFVRTIHHDYTVSDEWNRRYDRPRGMVCRAGTEGADFVPELDVRATDPVVTKHRYSGFFQTDLDLYLSTNNVSHVLLAGASTNVCVASTMHGAYNRDYRVTLLSDCCLSLESELHEAALKTAQQYFGDVRESSDIALPPLTPPETV